MKKTFILLAATVIGLSANAQTDVVKNAERAMKDGKAYTEVLSIITPAMSNPETSGLAQTYYIPGKAGFKQYDDLLGHLKLGMAKDGDDVVMANALIGGYDNFIKALALDTVVDAKGKTKTKYSKDIVSNLAGHYTDFTDIGAVFYNNKDFANAYKSWDIFCDLSKNGAKYGIKVLPDSTVSMYMFNRSLAAWSLKDYEKAVKSFRDAIANGYDTNDVFEYAYSNAKSANDVAAMLEFATEGNRRYGDTNPNYINYIINYYLETEKYDDAIVFLDKAISERPDNAQYYALEGIIYDNKEDAEKAKSLYLKALDLDPENGVANFYYGRALALIGGKLSDDYDGDMSKFPAYKEKNVYPVFRDAVKYLEKAYEVDKSNHAEILKTLGIVYYQLNDQAGMDSVDQRKLDD